MEKPVAKLTSGSREVRELVLDAARHDAKEMDMSGIMWLEHVNLIVGDESLAKSFYQTLLGFTRDIESSSLHLNIGQQQFHLSETGDEAQVLAGSIGIVVPSLAKLRERLPQANQSLEGTKFGVIRDCTDCISMSCPWGNCLHIYDLESEQDRKSSNDSVYKMVRMHAEGGMYASRMAVRGKPGIRYCELSCPVGTASLIAHFYREMLGCTVYEPTTSKQAAISVGPGVHLVFNEQKTLSETEIAKMKGVHICIYVTDFRALYDRLSHFSLVWTNVRFMLDSCDTWEEAEASRTLRFRYIIDLTTGKKLMELEHETRPLRHGQYMKVPKYDPI